MIYEYIILQYNMDKERVERRYGIIFGSDESDALYKLGKYYDIMEIEYFGCVSEDEDDVVYEFNDDWADDYSFSGRKFKKMIPELNKVKRDDIYE
ncbi:MAG TPA: hypothetical protein DCL29_02035 [Eubacterium sp.]|nr:hypothetical protein [Eubacterium sp.]